MEVQREPAVTGKALLVLVLRMVPRVYRLTTPPTGCHVPPGDDVVLGSVTVGRGSRWGQRGGGGAECGLQGGVLVRQCGYCPTVSDSSMHWMRGDPPQPSLHFTCKRVNTRMCYSTVRVALFC